MTMTQEARSLELGTQVGEGVRFRNRRKSESLTPGTKIDVLEARSLFAGYGSRVAQAD